MHPYLFPLPRPFHTQVNPYDQLSPTVQKPCNCYTQRVLGTSTSMTPARTILTSGSHSPPFPRPSPCSYHTQVLEASTSTTPASLLTGTTYSYTTVGPFQCWKADISSVCLRLLCMSVLTPQPVSRDAAMHTCAAAHMGLP